MKKAFTIVEVSILFVIFLIVAFLVVPLSLDDTMTAKSEARWRNVQSEFENIFYSINTQKDTEDYEFSTVFNSAIKNESKNIIEPYKITFKNGTFPSTTYRFPEYNVTYRNAVYAYKLFDKPSDGILGVLMYDVNGQVGPNVWGNDVFGYDIYEDKFEPFCKSKSVAEQRQDCSKNGTGLCCSSYFLMGGSAE